MSGYLHRRVYSLRYTDFDFADAFKLSSLLALVQEAACSSADELGFGYADLKPKNFGFLTVNTYCKLLHPVRIGDELTVETWPLPPRHVIFERDTRVKNQRGEEVALLASRWCLVDLKNFSLLPPEALGPAHAACPYNPERTVSPLSWKFKKFEEGEGREVSRIRVTPSKCDHYLHANNTYYADFFCDCFSFEELSRPLDSFQIAYLKQAKPQKELVFFRKDEDFSSSLEARLDGELITQFRLNFAKE